MKRLLCCLLLGAAAFGAKASHLMGGDLIVTNIGPNQFEVKLTEYRDTLGIPLYASEPIQIYSYDAVNNTYNLDTTLQVDLNVALSTLLLPNFPYGVEVGVYNDTITLPTGQYRMVMSSCCRNAAILNTANPSSESMVLYTDFTVDANGGNNSPNFLAMPVAYFPLGDTVTFNPLPYDADGDSLAWSLNVPYTMSAGATSFDTVVGFVAPSADPAGPFTMNPVNGEITWIPDMLGNFVQSFTVDEYRNGVKIGTIVRDFQYVIVLPDTSNPNAPNFVVNNTSVNYNVAGNYNWMYYYPGSLLNFEIKGTDADANTTLTMQGYAEIFILPNNPATFSTTLGVNEITGTLDWTPDAAYYKDVILVFRLQDGQWTRDWTLLLKKGTPNNIHGVFTSQNEVALGPNPTTNTLHVKLDLATDIDGDISMYSTLGQKVATFQKGKLAKGEHRISQSFNLASGTYYVIVRDGNKIIKSIPVSVK